MKNYLYLFICSPCFDGLGLTEDCCSLFENSKEITIDRQYMSLL